MLKEFKGFAVSGSVVDMPAGMVGAAFSPIAANAMRYSPCISALDKG
ncbi:MAG: hypothetical protein P8180_13440 [Gammaproteobacteria bacterium]|jgi:large-conductance mechanosensitive channel